MKHSRFFKNAAKFFREKPRPAKVGGGYSLSVMACCAALLSFAACGGEEETVVKTVTAPDTSPRVVRVVVTPISAHAVKGGSPLELTALVAGMHDPSDLTVEWLIDGNQSENQNGNQSGNTSITPVLSTSGEGLERARLSVGTGETAETITVWAVSNYNRDVKGKAEITVLEEEPTVQNVTVSASENLYAGPPYARRGGSLQFSAVVIGETGVSPDVEWGVLGNNLPGTHIDGGQLIVDAGETSPALVVTARSLQDPAVSGAALALVSYVTKVTASPGTATVERGGEHQFTAVVEGRNIPPEMAGVTWSVSGGKNNTETAVTTVSESGLLTVVADEAGTEGALTVRATSLYDPAAYAEIKPVIAQVSTVTVSPSSSVSVTKGGTRQFSATVTGTTANKAVTWSVTSATGAVKTGTAVSANGLLTVAADESAASLTVTAKSVYDTGKSASVSVTIGALTVRFLNGGTVMRTDSVSQGATVTPPALPANTKGSVVKGWYTASSGGTKLAGATPPITANTDFYVQKISLSDIVPLNAMGGEVKFISTSTGFDEAHIFRESGTLTVSKAPASQSVKMLVVAGGGGGGYVNDATLLGGGGGGGGVIVHNTYSLNAGSYAVTVGSGGPASASLTTTTSSNGGDSSFGSAIIAIGGGGGGGHGGGKYQAGLAGGSSGGSTHIAAATTNTTQSTNGGGTAYGNKGGVGGTVSPAADGSAGGGGGAGGSGGNATAQYTGAKGGIGVSSDITGVSVYYGGGGAAGGVMQSVEYGAAGTLNGEANTGDGGGGGGKFGLSGGKGGSGIVVVRFPYQYSGN